jgi:hypothetical protein
LKFVGEDSESLSDENAVSGVNLKFVRELVKRGIVLAAMVCGRCGECWLWGYWAEHFVIEECVAEASTGSSGFQRPGSYSCGAFGSLGIFIPWQRLQSPHFGLGRCIFYSLILSNYSFCG